MSKIDVLDKGYVRLTDSMGSDLTVVDSARVSFNKQSDWDVVGDGFESDAPDIFLKAADKRLLYYLAEHNHLSPFRHCVLSFEIYAPLMVMRQWGKYRVGSTWLFEDSDDPIETWNESCFPGHQTLRSHWGKQYTVEELFSLSQKAPSRLPKVRSVTSEGEIIQNKIKAVWKAGVQSVYKVTSALGFEVEATGNHRFLTTDGWVKLDHLQIGESVMMNGVPVYRDKTWLEEHYIKRGLEQKEMAKLAGCSHHTVRKWVHEFGLQQDQVKRMLQHNQKFGVFGKGETNETNEVIRERSLRMAKARKGIPAYAVGERHHAWKGDEASIAAGYARARDLYKPDKCDYCDATEKIEIHHRDRNPMNNDKSNIGFLCSKHHRMVHGLSVLMVAHPAPIANIEYVGEFDTYDIEMEQEPNLVVNQFVVHNSRRYVTEEPEFYIPDASQATDPRDSRVGVWRSAPENKKQGSGEPMTNDTADFNTSELKKQIESGLYFYNCALAEGTCAEQARLFLPAYALYIRARWTVSLQGVIHFLQQRLSEDAQWEVRQFAAAVRDLSKPLFPESVQVMGL